MPGGPIGGQGPLWQRTVWVFISCCIIVAVWNTFPHDANGFYKELGNKSEQLRGIAGGVVDWLNLDSLGGSGEGGSEKPDGPAKKKQTGRD